MQHSVQHAAWCPAYSRCSINVCWTEFVYIISRKCPMCLSSAIPGVEDGNEFDLWLVSVWNANFLPGFWIPGIQVTMWNLIFSAKRHLTTWIKNNCISCVLFSPGVSQKEVESLLMSFNVFGKSRQSPFKKSLMPKGWSEVRLSNYKLSTKY